MPKPSLIRPVVSIQTDRQDRRTHDDSYLYCASIAKRGNMFRHSSPIAREPSTVLTQAYKSGLAKAGFSFQVFRFKKKLKSGKVQNLGVLKCFLIFTIFSQKNCKFKLFLFSS